MTNRNSISKTNVLGVDVAATNLTEFLDYLRNYDFSVPHYISLLDVATLVRAWDHPQLMAALNQSLFTLPDGMPVAKICRHKGYPKTGTVSGYWLIEALLSEGVGSHYFYGTTPDVLNQMEKKLRKRFPNANILGFLSPPFLRPNEISGNEIIKAQIAQINALRPDFIWVGIGGHKQDVLMHAFRNYLSHGLMIGIGAVFDYYAGTLKKSPEIVKRLYLRQFFRLFQQPSLIRRSFSSNSRFLWRCFREYIIKM